MRPADVPAVLERLREQNERDGTSYRMPQVFDERGVRLAGIPLALVAVDTETGEVVQGHIYETTLEQMSFGTDARATVCSIREQEAVFFLLRERGFSDIHILVPEQRAHNMQHGLEKTLKMSATGMRHFYRRLDSMENEELRNWYREQKK